MKAYSMTDIGQKRTVNQDYVFSSLEPVGNLPNLFIVADGMGGHQAGDFASRYAVEQLVLLVKESTDTHPIAIMNKTISQVNTMIIEKSLHEPDLYGMGTTLVMAALVEQMLYVANIGDSRLYVINDTILQITKDHSLVEEMVAKGELTRDSEGYYSKKNIITRAIGGALEVTADFFELEVGKGDYIVMCTDGLTNMVSDNEIEQIMHSAESLQQKAEQLIALANANGGRDNIAVVLIQSESGVSEVDIC